MVLCPEFLPRDEPQPGLRAPRPAARAQRPAPARRRPLPRPSRRRARRERLSGTLQYVFGNEPGYSVDESFGGAVDAEQAGPAPRERHRDPPPLRRPGG